MKAIYHVERNEGDPLGWQSIFGTGTRSRQFCEGWVAAMNWSCYPSKPLRIISTASSGDITIVTETKGRGEHTN